MAATGATCARRRGAERLDYAQGGAQRGRVESKEDCGNVRHSMIDIEMAHCDEAHVPWGFSGLRHADHVASVRVLSPTMKCARNQGEA